MNKYFKIYIMPSIIMLTLSTSFLFIIKNKVALLCKEIKLTNSKILDEKGAIHILKAEYSYLTNPTRIERLVSKNLTLYIPKKEQIYDLNSFKIFLKNHTMIMDDKNLIEKGIEN